MQGFCGCKDCKKMKRKGKILGSRIMGYWMDTYGDDRKYEYYYGNVSDYVPFARFAKGKRVRRAENKAHAEIANSFV
jgi:hypothetical protein